ncbi:hypothetical protein BGZ60DRAFT_412047 [Tricladium varicosporioides]|nr:hypothetical protein BGZ60DRAFT_412047 [Hymenoscyphus varicosporioides]
MNLAKPTCYCCTWIDMSHVESLLSFNNSSGPPQHHFSDTASGYLDLLFNYCPSICSVILIPVYLTFIPLHNLTLGKKRVLVGYEVDIDAITRWLRSYGATRQMASVTVDSTPLAV